MDNTIVEAAMICIARRPYWEQFGVLLRFIAVLMEVK